MAFAPIGQTLEAIYEAAVRPEAWPRALEMVADHVGAMGALIAYHDFTSDAGLLICGRLREDLTELYLQRHGRNLYSTAIISKPAGIPHIGENLVESEKIRRTEMHADIFVLQKIAEQIMVGHKPFIRRDTTGGFAVMLDARQADHAHHAARGLARLAPHLTRALDLTRTNVRRRQEVENQSIFLRTLPCAAFLLDRMGALIEVNRAGEALLVACDAISINPDGRLHLVVGSQHPLQGALNAAAAPLEDAAAPAAPIRIARQGGPPLLLTVTRLASSLSSCWSLVDPSAALLVQVLDPFEEDHGAGAAWLTMLFDLSPAEARVAVLVGGGQTAPQAAATLGVSVNTVRTHLARCFDKLQIHSQTALCRLVASFPRLQNYEAGRGDQRI